MNKTEITLTKLLALDLETAPLGCVQPDFVVNEDNIACVMAMNVNLNHLGYTLGSEMIGKLRNFTVTKLEDIFNEVLPVLKSLVGADVKYDPMYPNFPKQVMEASDCELYLNAILHYWTSGSWSPEYEKEVRAFGFEPNHKLREIKECTGGDLVKLFGTLISSNDSLSDKDKEILTWFFDSEYKTDLINGIPDSIPYKETMCMVAGIMFKKGLALSETHTLDNTSKQFTQSPLKTATDVLRFVTYLSEGDISLAEKTKFKSFKRSERRVILSELERVISEDDIARHKTKWVKLFHNLHIGDYANNFPKSVAIASKIRNNETLSTLNGKVEMALEIKDIFATVELLRNNAGDFARRLDHILRLSSRKEEIKYTLETFEEVVDNVSSRVLTQVYGNFKNRFEDDGLCLVFPKGSVSKAQRIQRTRDPISKSTINSVKRIIRNSLIARWKKLPKLGNVWINPELENFPLPTGQRSASDSLFTVARGSKLPIGDDSTLRFFVYWKGRDIDLSATFYSDDFAETTHVSYTNLKNDSVKAYHSGDIVSAPKGASEFIDIHIDSALSNGYRYVAMNVLSYSCIDFSDIETVYAGWMTRSKPNSNEIYDPKTVVQKIDLNSPTQNQMPVMFDLKERKAIYVDVTLPKNTNYGGNNVESNRASIQDLVKTFTNLPERQFTLLELATQHAKARGKVVKAKEEADFTFDLTDSDITPYDVNKINSDLLV